MNRSSTSTTDVVRVRLRRFDPDAAREPWFETFDVPYAPRMRVIEVLDYIHEKLAHDIGYTWFCGTKKCGHCGVMLNGRPVLACWEAAEANMTLEPLRGLPVVRDLVVSRDGYEDTLRKLAPLLVRKNDYAGFPEPLTEGAMEAGAHLRDCIQCLACQAACPVIGVGGTEFAGPAPIVQLAELALDPRDGADRARLAGEVARIWMCTSCYECEAACPNEIPIVSDAIEPLKRLAYARGVSGGARHVRAFTDTVKANGRIVAWDVARRTGRFGFRALRTALRMAFRGKLEFSRPRAAPALRRLYDDLDGRKR